MLSVYRWYLDLMLEKEKWVGDYIMLIIFDGRIYKCDVIFIGFLWKILVEGKKKLKLWKVRLYCN